MCYWGTARPVFEHFIADGGEPITAYKVLKWNSRRSMFASPVKDRFWNGLTMSSGPMVHLGRGRGIYCYKNRRAAVNSWNSGHVVTVELSGCVLEFGADYLRGKEQGYKAEYAKIVNVSLSSSQQYLAKFIREKYPDLSVNGKSLNG